jgi:HNH endonuclease
MRAHQRQRRELLRTRAGSACEYCRIPEMLMGGRLTEDHIIPLHAGGIDEVENLCWCCWWCNVFKGSQTTASDPRTGVVVPLFNPRQDPWATHFRWSRSGVRILGQTATGRATVEALRMNDPDRMATRRFWVKYGVHPRGTT